MKELRLIQRGAKEIHAIRPRLLLVIFIRSVFQGLSPFINIYMSARILNALVEKEEFFSLLMLTFFTILLNLIVAIVLAIFNHIIALWQSEFNMLYDTRLNFKVTSLDYADVENPKIHKVRQKINEMKNLDGSGVVQLLNCFQAMAKNVFVIVFATSMTLSLFFSDSKIEVTSFLNFLDSVWASLLLLVFIVINIVVSMYASKTVTGKMYTIMNGMIPFNRVFSYYMENYISTYHAGKDIRIYHQSNLISSELNTLFVDVDTVTKRLANNQTKFSAMTSAFAVAVSMLIYLFVGLKALTGAFAVGMVVQYIGSINEFTNGFTDFMRTVSKLRANNEALRVYFQFMDMTARMNKGTLSLPKNDGMGYVIEFRNVSFRYPDSNTYALEKINLRFHLGKKIAVVGENGSGKTTMIKLLCRLYDPTEGEILLNGVDIRQYYYEEYLKLFSVVFQDFKLLSFSLVQNVAVSTEYRPEQVEECLKLSGFYERLSRMPDGVETYLYKDFEESGVEISGGESQKIALARALYKDAPFIVLDEPTAALDPIAEADIYTHFDHIVENKGAIYISHRLSSCKFCDTIYVFDRGRIIQEGTHEDLVGIANGKYRELWDAQAQYYTEK